ncbi:ribonucleoside diphosphate reductase, alpha subunit [Candidatus Methylobacter favarea]|uniref:Ribonucleoside-diphosphate reductase n=1 Tax=Candidatus Methylobacter favarea TaxID=2707345 RepID=A0A8S0X8J7_9GAMM|nr:ribonucleoside-diphosphate reductase subunit alpha [Candidatus Methylobacter favarea]CAA9891210.1 ribonucleoside diphosphate reductase, alpha subunit [Candidatus Methylobacter favarea]
MHDTVITAPSGALPGSSQTSAALPALQVIRRNGAAVAFNPEKIAIAMSKAFLAVEHGQTALSSRVREQVTVLTQAVVSALIRRLPAGGSVHIEDIQDQVELALMRSGAHDVAKAYVLYREKRTAERAGQAHDTPQLHITIDDNRQPLDIARLTEMAAEACLDLGAEVSPKTVVEQAVRDLYDGISFNEVRRALILSARSLIEREPAYNYVTARLLLDLMRAEVLAENISHGAMHTRYAEYFPHYIKLGVEAGLLDQRLAQFDLHKLGAAIAAERDFKFGYLGLQTLYDRYFLHIEEQRIELPQIFFMRVAMGLAINEIDREERAIEFYNVLSSFDFMSSTPTLFNSGTVHAQLSSCYLTTVSDDLDGIYQAIKENALLQKYAGGIGNDWTPVRALGSRIKGTNGKSQGVIPFLKVVNDTAVAVNQGGKRKGAVCGYLETWHLDIEEFLDLRKNTGDDRRRTHDMNTAHWIPDLFMQRVIDNAEWTLFSPSDVPDLHEKFGKAFAAAYCQYERRADFGEIKQFKRVSALQLWRKMLTMLFETGHPWITFKDACNIRSPQQHAGIVHSSNLCTEITLNTSATEIAVCNLGSVNLTAHLMEENGKLALDQAKLKATITTAMRMLDNVIDVNFYAVGSARNSNLRHRPVGLGIMGFQDCLHALRIPYASMDAVEFADSAMETVCYHAYSASSRLAEERGAYSSFKGSLWDQGVLPPDTLNLLSEARGGQVEVDRSSTLDWDALRTRIQQHGMRNSNCVAIAPTATIANIIGVSASIEPDYQNLYVKSNLSGEFTVVNETLVDDLKALDLWDEVMAADIKYYDGSLARIDRIPAELKALYATAFEIDPSWLVEAAARRQKWIDQAQSLNLYFAVPSGKKLHDTYLLAWQRGLKTSYYLRSLAATSAEKSTGAGGELNSVLSAMPEPKQCLIDDPGCEACQ